MAESNKDDLADALKKLAEGHHQSDRADQQSSSGAVNWFGATPAPDAPTEPNAEAEASDPKPSARTARLSAPQSSSVDGVPSNPTPPRRRSAPSADAATPFAEAAPVAPVAPPSRPARPVTPPILPAALTETAAPRRERPVAPVASRPIERVETPDTPAETIVEDEDDLGIGAVSADNLARRRTATKKPPFYATLGFRQTIIPPLLTMGVALPAAGGWLMTLDPDSPVRLVGMMLPLSCFAGGLVLLGLGVVNVLSVKSALK